MHRVIDTLAFTIERIRQHLLLVVWVLVGMTVAITLALSLPLFVDAVYSDILATRLDNPPYAYLYRYLGVWEGNVTEADAASATAAIEGQFVDSIGLPVDFSTRYVRIGNWTTRTTATNQPLGSFGIGALTGSNHLINIVEGTWPPEALTSASVPLLLPESLLFSMGVQVGDELTLQRAGDDPVEAYVAALWHPLNEDDPAWMFPPRFFEQVLLVPQEQLFGMVGGIEEPIDELAWYISFDGTDLRTSDIEGLLSTSTEAQRAVELVLPGISLSESPEARLQAFVDEVNALTQQLFIIVLPVGGLVLYFISLVAGLLVTRQQNEDVKLRSRGMSRNAVLTIHVLMWALIISVSLLISLVISPLVVQFIGRTVSFLDFSGASSVNEVVFTADALLIGVAVGVLAASSGLFLAWRITRQNINSLKRVSTVSRKAWWQRAYLDVVAVAIAGYVLYTLIQQNGITSNANTPFSDPLTFIGPTLFALGLSLLLLRILPMVLVSLNRLVGLTTNIPLLMALRELTRNIGRYRGTLLMTAFTLSLVGFTASMASTLDQSLLDVIQYDVGAEVVIVTVADAQTETQIDEATGEQTEELTGYNAPPVLELQALPEIETLSRMGRYEARLSVAGQRLNGIALGIDRAGLGGVTYMRDDYSEIPLGNMLNELAGNRTGVILSQETAEQFSIGLGQEVRYQVNALGEWQSEIRATVVGFIEYFPTIDPAEVDFFLLTSIDPIFEVSGTPLPYNVWLNIPDDVSLNTAQEGISTIEFPVLRYEDVESRLEAAYAEPSRRGVLGFLSVGFVASIVLTLIGTVIQSTVSFQEQSTQLGSLRAMGLSSFSVQIYILVLQGLLAISSVGGGTLIGLGATLLYLPLFDFSGGLPPYLVRVAWDEIALVYVVFGSALVLVAILLALFLSRQQLSQAVKLGNI